MKETRHDLKERAKRLQGDLHAAKFHNDRAWILRTRLALNEVEAKLAEYRVIARQEIGLGLVPAPKGD